MNDEQDQYFKYYSQLQHQQNMLQDDKRTLTYRNAIMFNASNHFKNKLVLDVGAGSGILSYFAVQAGANHVYAVEASTMANKMMKLMSFSKNDYFKEKISILHAKIEQSNLNIPMVDTIVSEPIGVFLFHERMIESYIYARDHYLKPGGTLFPSLAVIHLAPFTDSKLWKDTKSSADFWKQDSFHNIDISCLYNDACQELFSMPVIGHFDSKSIMTNDKKNEFQVDFNTVTIDALHDIEIPFDWTSSRTGIMHGVAGWFDIVFSPPGGNTISLSTSPDTDETHWYQTRFLFMDPLPIKANQQIKGWMRCIANTSRSYTIYIEVNVGDPTNRDNNTISSATTEIKRTGQWELQEQTFSHS